MNKHQSKPFSEHIRNFMRWLEVNGYLAEWVQCIGVITALIFGYVQIRHATEAIQTTAVANEIALENSASDLLVEINRAALDHPDAAGNYPAHKRLHLLRLHYFHRMFGLRRNNLIGDDAFEAEGEYLRWAGKQTDFMDVWSNFRLQYPTPFREWVDGVLKFEADIEESKNELDITFQDWWQENVN